jgi:hypothetical protein
MDAPKRSSAVVWAVAVLVLLPVLYFLSLGPLLWCETHFSDDPELPIWDAYAGPVKLLFELAPQSRPVLQRYFRLWDF